MPQFGVTANVAIDVTITTETTEYAEVALTAALEALLRTYVTQRHGSYTVSDLEIEPLD